MVWPVQTSHTLCGVAACPVLHKYIVEGLVSTFRQLLDSHGCDPLLTHSAFGVPAIDDTVITRPESRGNTDTECVNQACQKHFQIKKKELSAECVAFSFLV